MVLYFLLVALKIFVKDLLDCFERRKKKRLKVTSDCSPFTQSLGIESSLDFPIEIDKPNVNSIIQEPLLENESNIKDIFAVSHLDGKVPELEDIEMTIFKTHVIGRNENLNAFPIPSFLFQTQPEILFQNLGTEKTDQVQEVHSAQLNKGKNTNLLQHIDGQKLIKVTTSCTIDEMSKDDKKSNSSKTLRPVQISCSPKTLQLFTGEYQNTCQPNISIIREISSSTITEVNSNQSEYSYVMNNRMNNTEIKDSANVDSKYLHSIETELLREMSSRENVGMFQMKIRQDTFIIEPKQKASFIGELELINKKQMCNASLNDHCITSDIRNDSVQKKCLASNGKGNQTKKQQNKKVIKKSNNSVTANCAQKKPCSRDSAHLKARKSNSIDLITNVGKTKLFEDRAISDNLDFEKVNIPIFISKENLCNNNHSTSPFIHKNLAYSSSFETGQRPKRKSLSMCPTTLSEISGIKTPRLQNSSENSSANFSSEAREFLEFSSSFETGQRPKIKSVSMCPTTPSRISDSKIPRLQNSSENSGANSSSDARELLEISSSFEMGQRPKRKSVSMCPTTPSRISESKIPRLQNSSENCKANFSSEATSHMQKVSKTRNTKDADSCGRPTRLPVKCNNGKSLSTLQLSINDSSFLTPNRNALSPNSVVWMSGNKYFDSSSQEEEQFNKRESIAMILKSNPGHVQAKVHLYDDLVRENDYSTEIVPCHSTPTSKFNKKLSSSSQSLKSSSKHKTKLQSSNSISYSKKTLANRSHYVQNGKKSQKVIHNTQLNLPSPIKSYSLKDVTNTGFLLSASKGSKNVQIKNDTVSIFLDENNKEAVETRKKLKRNSFSGNASQKLPKKVSRSESTPGPRPHRRISCLIQESDFAK